MSTRISSRIALLLATGLVAGLLIPASAGAAEELLVAPIITSEARDGCDGTGEGAVVTFGGNITPGATLVEGVNWLRQHNATPQPSPDGTDPTIVGQREVSQHIQIAPDGSISGEVTITNIHDMARHLSLYLVVEKADVQGGGHSNALAIDVGPPRIVRYETVDAKTVRVVFSENVFQPQGDAPTDWRIDGALPSNVAGSGARRTLTITGTLAEDQEPFVTYEPNLTPGRAVYQDCVDQELRQEGRYQTAIDRIAPKIPDILKIDDKDASSSRVASKNFTDVEIEVGNVKTDHSVTIFRETNGQPELQKGTGSGSDTEVITLSGPTFSDSLGNLADNTEHKIYALATDVSGNDSVAADIVTFRTDNLAPLQLKAATNGKNVTLTFDDNLIAGRDNAQDWKIIENGVEVPITSVTGSGNVRVLHADNVENESTIQYLGSAGYTDEAGNPLAAFTDLAATGFIATVVDMLPETTPNAQVQSTQEFTIDILDDNRNPVPGTLAIVRAVSGPASSKNNDSPQGSGFIGSCTSQDDGRCSITYTSTDLGLDALQAWIDADGNLTTVNSPGTPEPRDADDEGSPTAAQNLKTQDVVEIKWVTQGVDLVIDALNESGTAPVNRTQPVDVRVSALDAIGRTSAAIGNVPVGLKVTAGGNEGTFEYCQTTANGVCSLTYIPDSVGTDTVLVWIDADEDGLPNEVSVDGEQGSQEPSDADGNLIDDEAEHDVVTRSWTAPAFAVLLMTPNVQITPSNQPQGLHMYVYDTAGASLPGMNIDARVISGPHGGLRIGECTTDASGRCNLSYSHSALTFGIDVVQAWIDADGNNIADEATQTETHTTASGGTDEPDQDVSRIEWRKATATPTPTPTTTPTKKPTTAPSPTANPMATPSPTASTIPNPTASPTDGPDPEANTGEERSLSVYDATRRIAYGRTAEVVGQIRATENCRVGFVEFQRQDGDSWVTLQRELSGTDGWFDIAARPSTNGVYRVAMDTEGNCLDTATDPFKIDVKVRVAAKALKKVIAIGSCVKIKGSVTPNKSPKIQIQLKNGRRWQELGSAKLRNSGFRFSTCFNKVGRFTLRAVYEGDLKNAGGAKKLSIRVR